MESVVERSEFFAVANNIESCTYLLSEDKIESQVAAKRPSNTKSDQLSWEENVSDVVQSEAFYDVITAGYKTTFSRVFETEVNRLHFI